MWLLEVNAHLTDFSVLPFEPTLVIVDFLISVNVQLTITFQLHYFSPELPFKSVVGFYCFLGVYYDKHGMSIRRVSLLMLCTEIEVANRLCSQHNTGHLRFLCLDSYQLSMFLLCFYSGKIEEAFIGPVSITLSSNCSVINKNPINYASAYSRRDV